MPRAFATDDVLQRVATDAANPVPAHSQNPSTTTPPPRPSRSRGLAGLRLVFWLLLLHLFCASRSPRPPPPSMARVYADVNQHMPRAYWDYDSVNISWGVLENYEVVRKIGAPMMLPLCHPTRANMPFQVEESTRKSSRASTS